MRYFILFCICTAILTSPISCTSDDSAITINIYESPLALNSGCVVSNYFEFDSNGNKVSSVDYSYDSIGRIIRVDGLDIPYFEYNTDGNYMYYLELNDSIYQGITYLEDTIKEHSIRDEGTGTNNENLIIYNSVIHSGLNANQQPSRSDYFVIANVEKTYDHLGNLIYADHQGGIARWDYYKYEHDIDLQLAIPLPGPFPDRFNALTKEVFQDIPHIVTHKLQIRV